MSWWPAGSGPRGGLVFGGRGPAPQRLLICVQPSAARSPGAAGAARLTERDRLALAFAAEHRLVLGAQMQALLGVSAAAAAKRLRALVGVGHLISERQLHGQPGCYQITRSGLGAIESTLPRPRAVDLSCYRHDVGLGWLWLHARAGRFGPARDVVAERRMRSQDRRDGDRDARFGVRLGGPGPGGGERLHYPDLLVELQSGHRVAFELELTSKSRRRREGILAGFAGDRRIDVVAYLVDRPASGRAIARSAARLGIADLVHVQPVSFDPPRSVGGGAERSPARPRRRAREPATGHRSAREAVAGQTSARAPAGVDR